MERLLVILLCFVVFGCNSPDDEEVFIRSEKIYTNTGLVSMVAFDEDERTICLGMEEEEGAIVAASVDFITKDKIVNFRSSNEFLLVQDAPGDIVLAANCIYVERGYADSPKKSVEVGVIAYTVKIGEIDEK